MKVLDFIKILCSVLPIASALYLFFNKDRKYEDMNNYFNYKKVQAKRQRRLGEVCGRYHSSLSSEHSSLHNRKHPVNERTGSKFEIGENKIFMCNVLKGGSNSWKMFLSKKKIKVTSLEEEEFSLSYMNKNIVQVRHPMERLLGTWRHLFNDEGWKSLENPEFVDVFEEFYSKTDFPRFVEDFLQLGLPS